MLQGTGSCYYLYAQNLNDFTFHHLQLHVRYELPYVIYMDNPNFNQRFYE